MKKIIGLVLLLMLAVGMLAGFTAQADPQGTCGSSGTPIDLDCDYTDANGVVHHCLLWIGDPSVDPSGTLAVCNNPPPAP